ncbi:uncharacterized protein PAC_10268 [Phialocephala subalpina]|uniref:Dystroglycan-type cadherin-like domain-containing protein n=1 Tax=Phialocephala subalpina TaxID=576137 RepID=A0A1L7X5S8_9HELO|nr:uncharacterized protein PAC_10268 [Phialocephala subalpina]
MALWRAISVAAIFGTLINAIPTVTFPLNSQVPPVARVSESFFYTFSSSTFFSTLPLTYTLVDPPSWLSLDNATRTLRGTPTVAVLGTDALAGVSFGLTASDTSGSTTLNATLVVSQNTAPSIFVPLSMQLQSFGTCSQPSTILYHPSTPFKISFDPRTFSFSSSSTGMFYYAVSVDNTPLPAWITFDKSTLSFSGQTPDYYSLIEPPQTFGIQLIASDVEGFAGTSINLDIEVGVHLLAFKNQVLSINAVAGDTISLDGLIGSLQIDGQPASIAAISSITAQVPPWMTFDNTTLTLRGLVPTGATSVNITVQATDIYTDTGLAYVYVDIGDISNSTVWGLFSQSIGSLNATIDASFSYDLGTYLNNRLDTSMTAQFSPLETWLSFDPQSFVFTGQIPSNVKPSEIEVTLNASSNSDHSIDSQSFVLSIATVSPNRPLGGPNPSSTASASAVVGNHRLSLKVILAIAIPIGLLAIGLLFAAFCCYRRSRTARWSTETPAKSDISSPMEARMSMAPRVRPGRLNPPEVHLNTTGFGVQESATSSEDVPNKRASKASTKQEMRKSQSMFAVNDTPLSPLQESSTSGNRTRAVSDNGLSKTDPSWSSTQGSAYPTLRSSATGSSRTQRLSRNYSNYSRKGHSRRSAVVFSANPPRPVMTSRIYSQYTTETTGDSILGLQDVDFTSTPLDDFSALARHTAVLDTPQTYARKTTAPQRASKQRSRFMSSSGRPLSGLGHGTRGSVSSSSGPLEKRRSVGHGQDWMDGQSLSRDSRTWLTVGTQEMSDQNRRSNTSALSDFSDPRRGYANVDARIRAVTKSPAEPVSSGANSRQSRPLSRRVGSSPFFAGSSSSRNSRRSPKKTRTSYADSPTVPEEATMASNLTGPPNLGFQEQKQDDLPRDSFGISYGMAREGTRQLRSYIQSQLARTKSKRSMKSMESKDSRFESAAGSMLSLPQSRAQRSPERQQIDADYENFLRDGFSEESWETQGSDHPSQENIVLFDAEESTEMILEAVQARSNLAWRPGTSASNPVSPRPGTATSEVRCMRGAQRRPLSVDVRANHRPSRSVVERGIVDYTAYI